MLGDEIGKGAYGRVYKGLDLENGDFVAIKQGPERGMSSRVNITIILDPVWQTRNYEYSCRYMGREFWDKVLSEPHPGLHTVHVVVHDSHVLPGTMVLSIWMYVENGSLANIIKPNKFGPFPESLVAVYIAQVLEGLVYLHEQGVIHRDIKGANILTTKEVIEENIFL
ncbi:hypothetical protein ACLOJK_004734 [Asimina triloba]